jgi:hypothetical protein
LLGDAHGPQLGGDVRAHSTGEREPGEHRRQLEHDRLADERADEVERNGAGERVARQQREHDAGKRGDEEGDRQRLDAELECLRRRLREPGAHIAETDGNVANKSRFGADR